MKYPECIIRRDFRYFRIPEGREMIVYLVQHGEAVLETVDPERPLSQKGREDVSKVAKFLSLKNLQIDEVWHSEKLRTKETAAIFHKVLCPNAGIFQKDKMKPNDPISDIEIEIAAYDKNVMLVGHLPFMSKLCSKLIAGNEDKPVVNFQQGGVATVEKSQNFWRINWIIIPAVV